MSAFLGPIHYWLYQKVQLQEELILLILETDRQMGWNTISAEKLDKVCGEADMRPLEEVIDQANIHGWLQDKIRVSEIRLAFLVTELLKGESARFAQIKQAAYCFGENHSVEKGIGADEALKILEDTLLDGMPCDQVNMVIDSTEDRASWQRMRSVHQEYWEQAGGESSVYDTLRVQIIEGMLANSGLTFHTVADGLFEIRKE